MSCEAGQQDVRCFWVLVLCSKQVQIKSGNSGLVLLSWISAELGTCTISLGCVLAFCYLCVSFFIKDIWFWYPLLQLAGHHLSSIHLCTSEKNCSYRASELSRNAALSLVVPWCFFNIFFSILINFIWCWCNSGKQTLILMCKNQLAFLFQHVQCGYIWAL